MNWEDTLRVIRILAFIPLAPIYLLGVVQCNCLLNDEHGGRFIPDWPLEARGIVGWFWIPIWISAGIYFGTKRLWKEFGGITHDDL